MDRLFLQLSGSTPKLYPHYVLTLVNPRTVSVRRVAVRSKVNYHGVNQRVAVRSIMEIYQLGRPGFDSRPSQAKDFKLVVEATLSSAQHIKGSSTQKLVDPLPE